MDEAEQSSTIFCKILFNNLSSWKYRSSPKQILHKAILQQDRFGWKPFIGDFGSKCCWEYQQQHLDSITSPSLCALLLSKAQHQIWHIAWEIWLHRNDHLHGEHSSTSVMEQAAINDDVMRKWTLWLSMLTVQHWHLLNGSLEDKINKSYHNKHMWPATVWTARETGVQINYLENNKSQSDSTIWHRYRQLKRWQYGYNAYPHLDLEEEWSFNPKKRNKKTKTITK